MNGYDGPRQPTMDVNAANLLDQAMEVFDKAHRAKGVTTDPVVFVGGFVSCFGIMTGRVNVGWPEDKPLAGLFDKVHRDIHDYMGRVAKAQIDERLRGG